jgi:hypothetical protein
MTSPDGPTSFTASDGSLTVALRPQHARGVLVWITGLAPDGGRYAASIAEVAVEGTA